MSNLQSAKTNLSSPKNSTIDLSHDIFTSTDFMYFKPLLVEEMLPSDSFDITLNDYFRASPLPNPVYGRIKVSKAAFFVPNRILWKEWNTFLTGGQNGRLTRPVPKYPLGYMGECYRQLKQVNPQQAHLMFNYLSDCGIPPTFARALMDEPEVVSALPFRALKRVWWDWYRDSNLIGDELESNYNYTSSDVSLEECPRTGEWNILSNIIPAPVPFEKDYFTTAFIEPQRGEDSYAAVVLPDSRLNPSLNLSTTSATNLNVQGSSDDKVVGTGSSATGKTDVIGRLKYNTLRLAHSLQHYLERNNIAGANALQQLLAHWGTAPNPAVFNRSTYINSSDSDLNIDEVTSLSDTDTGDNGKSLGDVTTKANGSSTFHTSYTANEHGFLIVVQVMRPVTGYYQGLSRSLTRFDRFDYFTPEMECTGFQPIYSRELYFDHARRDNNDAIFGYAPRYAEYKFHNNRVSCDYTGLPEWHMMRDFSFRADALDREPLKMTTDISAGFDAEIYGADFSRIFGDSNKDFDHFIQVLHVKFNASRPMRGYTIPVIDEIAGGDTSLPYAGVRL